MTDELKKDYWNPEGVQAHLTITQSVIQRMSTNSASCKAWCIGLVSAILVVVVDKSDRNIALVALLPTLFLFLDAYYLALEKAFIASYNGFIDKLHKRQISASDLYAITPRGQLLQLFGNAALSLSVWPFYLTLVVVILLVQWGA
jgi:hypothetical protein